MNDLPSLKSLFWFSALYTNDTTLVLLLLATICFSDSNVILLIGQKYLSSLPQKGKKIIDYFTAGRSSKVVVKDRPLASICLDSAGKCRYVCSVKPLPWQIKSMRIITFFLPLRAYSAAFCRVLRRFSSRTYYP